MGKAPDHRIRKTKQLIKNTFIETLKEKSIQEISVGELSDKADINRGTFYSSSDLSLLYHKHRQPETLRLPFFPSPP